MDIIMLDNYIRPGMVHCQEGFVDSHIFPSESGGIARCENEVGPKRDGNPGRRLSLKAGTTRKFNLLAQELGTNTARRAYGQPVGWDDQSFCEACAIRNSCAAILAAPRAQKSFGTG